MNALVLIGWWFGLSLVAGVALGRLLERADERAGVGPPAHRGAAISCGAI